MRGVVHSSALALCTSGQIYNSKVWYIRNSFLFIPRVTLQTRYESRDLAHWNAWHYSWSAQKDFSSTALGKLDMSPHTSEIAPKLIFFLQKAIFS